MRKFEALFGKPQNHIQEILPNQIPLMTPPGFERVELVEASAYERVLADLAELEIKHNILRRDIENNITVNQLAEENRRLKASPTEYHSKSEMRRIEHMKASATKPILCIHQVPVEQYCQWCSTGERVE